MKKYLKQQGKKLFLEMCEIKKFSVEMYKRDHDFIVNGKKVWVKYSLLDKPFTSRRDKWQWHNMKTQHDFMIFIGQDGGDEYAFIIPREDLRGVTSIQCATIRSGKKSKWHKYLDRWDLLQ